MKKKIEIVESIDGCPYCMAPKGDKMVCCGEVHFEPLYTIEIDGDMQDTYYLDAEVEVLLRKNST